MSVPNIFIAATQQNNGKTTLSLGLMGALQLRHKNMGYIKPVGQRTVTVGNVCVDEDALLMEKVFKTKASLQDMNPVTVGQGFTTDWIMQPRENRHELEESILAAYGRVSAGRDFMVIEGTGHAGVGSVLNLSNARVAKILQAPVVLVAPGGVGRPIDEVALNAELLAKEGVKLAGVVINKVQMSKYEHVRKLVRRGFENLGIKVLGVFPYDEVLIAPSVREILEEIDGELVNDSLESQTLNTLVEHYVVGAMSTHQAMDYFKPGSVIITPSDREDIILAALGTAAADRSKQMKTLAAMILTGKTMPHPAILDLIHSSRIPVLICHQDTYTTASQVHDLLAKIRADDAEKIEHAARLVGDYFDFAAIYPEMA
jgi:BioD-like phosphotransacetylase family protein